MGTKPHNLEMKSILKKKSVRNNDKKIKWDEEKLMKSEMEKDSKMKITEPKTPYIHYDHESDIATTQGIAPFELEEAMKKIETSKSFEWSESEDEFAENRKKHYDMKAAFLDKSDVDENEKHRKFNESRKKHYKMGDALRSRSSLNEEE
jgi:protein phosphatase inhibitor 2